MAEAAASRRSLPLAAFWLLLAGLEGAHAVADASRVARAHAVAERAGWTGAQVWNDRRNGGDYLVVALADGLLAPAEAMPDRPRVEGNRAREAKPLLLTELRNRPGWAYGRYLFGRASLAAADPRGQARQALEAAIVAAPGLDEPVVLLAEIDLRDWDSLGARDRVSANARVRRAALNPEFVRQFFLLLVDRAGESGAIELLPRDAAVLRAALAACEQEGREEIASRLRGALQSALPAR